MVGRIIESLDNNTVLIIASDHGCTHWRRSVDFNARLLDEGFLVLLSEDEASKVEHQALPQIGDSVGVPYSWVDWEKTQAYSIGCGKIYLNLRGREGKGIVNPGSEAQALEDEIIQSFQSWVDPDNGDPVVSKVYRSREVQWGPLMNRAPELIVGLHGGYRVAFSSIRQISTQGPLKDNNKKISGDHISVDYKLVPGTILSNVRLSKESGYPHLLDIAPTILEFLGVEIPADMDGVSLWS
jgi:predicted AlkP superfamily phosphohydrolase/phosphomutase